MQQTGDDRRIDTTGKSTDNFAFTHSVSNNRNIFSDKIADRPVPFAAADIIREVLQDFLPLRSMDHFRVELDAVHSFFITDGSIWSILGLRQCFETRRHFLDAVAVAHPDGQRLVQPRK